MFWTFAILGWITEALNSLLRDKRLDNRGFLIGPYCPIYGIGALYMYFFLDRFSDNPVSVFVMALIGTSILEYFTSYIMEKIFKARWWDYSDRFCNIRGRICLRNALIFGIVGILFTYFLKPTYLNLINKIPSNVLIIIGVFLIIVFMIDYIASFTATYKIRSGLLNALGDSTSEIDKGVRSVLAKHKFQVRKMLKSFPDVTIELPGADLLKKSLKKVLDSMDLRKLIKEK